MGSKRTLRVAAADETAAAAAAAVSAATGEEQIWATYALSYDAVLPSLDFYREVVQRHTEALMGDDIDTVIDIGAGTGSVAKLLLLSGRTVTCIDNSGAMLELLRHKVRTKANDRVTIALRSAEDLSPWPDAAFDGVNILLALFAMANPLAALGHAMRVLRPGGVFVATEPKRSFSLEALLAHAEHWLRSQGLYDRLRVRWQRVCDVNRKIDPGRRLSPLPIEDISPFLVDRGFQILSVRDSHHGNCATVVARKGVAGGEAE